MIEALPSFAYPLKAMLVGPVHALALLLLVAAGAKLRDPRSATA